MSRTKLNTRWKACFLSILLVSLYLPVIGLAIMIHDNSDFIYVFTLILVFGVPAYIFYSLIGWLLIGMTVHRLIEKYTSSYFLYYFSVSLFLCMIIGYFFGMFVVFIYGIPIVLQTIAFWFFLKRLNAEV